MLKREIIFAALAAAFLSVGTAKVATAQAECEDCAEAYGDVFYAPDYWVDGKGELAGPGFYELVGCDDEWCYYYGGSNA